MKTALGGSSSEKDDTTAPRVMVRLSWNQGISPDGYVVTLQFTRVKSVAMVQLSRNHKMGAEKAHHGGGSLD